MVAERYNKLLSQALLLLLAALPSLIFFFFIPFTWNNTDTVCYFWLGLKYAVPQYPPLYNTLCKVVMLLFNGGPATVYIIVALQHLTYIAGLLYVAFILPNLFARAVFLLVISFNWNALLLINGLFPEGLYAGLQLFLWGSFFRFLLFRKHRFWSAFILASSLVFITLTKHIGQLYYALPLIAAVILLLSGKFNLRRSTTLLGIKMLLMGVVSFVLLIAIQSSVLALLNPPNKVTVGRQGAYRIKALPWAQLSPANSEALLQHYTAGNPDTMLRITYQLIINSNPWWETYQQIDSVLKERNIHTKNADDYLNDAYRAYLRHIEYYAIASIHSDVNFMFHDNHVGAQLLENNTLCYFHNANYVCPVELNNIWRFVFAEKNFSKLNALRVSGMFVYTTSLTVGFLLLLGFILWGVGIIRMSLRLWLILGAPLFYVLLYILANCIVTVVLTRYIVPCYVELWLTLAMLFSLLLAVKGKLRINDGV